MEKPLIITAKIDKRSLDRAIAMAMEVTTQEPQNIVLNAARGVALKAKDKTPFVTHQRIDQELDVIVTPKIGKRGQVLNQKYAKNKTYSGGASTSKAEGVPFAALIIHASVDPHSKYNRLTNFRWLRDSPFKGVSKAVGAQRMAETIHRLIATRHSSTHFLQAGWSAVYQKLTYLRNPRQALVEMSSPSSRSAIKFAKNKDFGAVNRGGAGRKVWLMIENLIGMNGKNADNYNRALLYRGGPALQMAVNEQAAEMQSHYKARWEAKMAHKWNAIP